MSDLTDLAAGIAGEHLVVADLLLQGYRAFMTEQHCPYDVVVEVDTRLVRVQVKSARAPRADGINQSRPAYVFNTRRAGRGGRRVYGDGDFDLIACVALDLRLIAYLGFGPQHVQMRVPGWMPPERDSVGRPWRGNDATGREFEDFTFEKAVANLV